MEYVATSRGYLGGRLIEAGESFEAKSFKGSWAVRKGNFKPEEKKDEATLITEAKEALQGRRGKKKASK